MAAFSGEAEAEGDRLRYHMFLGQIAKILGLQSAAEQTEADFRRKRMRAQEKLDALSDLTDDGSVAAKAEAEKELVEFDERAATLEKERAELESRQDEQAAVVKGMDKEIAGIEKEIEALEAELARLQEED